MQDKNHTSDQYLNATRVGSVYRRCRRPDTASAHVAKVEAWLGTHTFSNRELQASREEIIRMLLALDHRIRGDERGGGSLGMWIYRDDKTIWTQDMQDIEMLLALGMAVGLASFCATREAWHMLPGGIPYARIDITKFGVSVN